MQRGNLTGNDKDPENGSTSITKKKKNAPSI